MKKNLLSASLFILFSVLFGSSAFAQSQPGDACWAYGSDSMACHIQMAVCQSNYSACMQQLQTGSPDYWLQLADQVQAAIPPDSIHVADYNQGELLLGSIADAWLVNQLTRLKNAAQAAGNAAEFQYYSVKLEQVMSGVINVRNAPLFSGGFIAYLEATVGSAAVATGAAVIAAAGISYAVGYGLGYAYGYWIRISVSASAIDEGLTNYWNGTGGTALLGT